MALAYSAFPSPHHCSRWACLSNHPAVKSVRPRRRAVGWPTVGGSVAGSTSLHILGRASWSLNNFCFFMKQIMSLWIHSKTNSYKRMWYMVNSYMAVGRNDGFHVLWVLRGVRLTRIRILNFCKISRLKVVKIEIFKISGLVYHKTNILVWIWVHCVQLAITNCNLDLFQLSCLLIKLEP